MSRCASCATRRRLRRQAAAPKRRGQPSLRAASSGSANCEGLVHATGASRRLPAVRAQASVLRRARRQPRRVRVALRPALRGGSVAHVVDHAPDVVTRLALEFVLLFVGVARHSSFIQRPFLGPALDLRSSPIEICVTPYDSPQPPRRLRSADPRPRHWVDRRRRPTGGPGREAAVERLEHRAEGRGASRGPTSRSCEDVRCATPRGRRGRWRAGTACGCFPMPD